MRSSPPTAPSRARMSLAVGRASCRRCRRPAPGQPSIRRRSAGSAAHGPSPAAHRAGVLEVAVSRAIPRRGRGHLGQARPRRSRRQPWRAVHGAALRRHRGRAGQPGDEGRVAGSQRGGPCSGAARWGCCGRPRRAALVLHPGRCRRWCRCGRRRREYPPARSCSGPTRRRRRDNAGSALRRLGLPAPRSEPTAASPSRRWTRCKLGLRISASAGAGIARAGSGPPLHRICQCCPRRRAHRDAAASTRWVRAARRLPLRRRDRCPGGCASRR